MPLDINAPATLSIMTPAQFLANAGPRVKDRLHAGGMSVMSLRPYIGKDGYSYITINQNGKLKAVRLMTANATLRKDEWKELDEALIPVARIRLNGVADLQSRGLVHNMRNGLGSTVLEYESVSDSEAASVSLDGITRGGSDRPEFDISYLPLPIVHKDFHFNARVLAASRTRGDTLDTTMAQLSTIRVTEKVEDILFNGLSSYKFGGGIIYGYTDHPSRNTGSHTAWTTSGKTGTQMLEDVLAMKQDSLDARRYGPWVLYISKNYETILDEDFKANSDRSIRERIKMIEGIEDVKVSDSLSDSTLVLVQMTPDTVRIVNGLGITPVEWDEQGGMVLQFKIMTIQVPQIRADQDGRCGVVHYSTS